MTTSPSNQLTAQGILAPLDALEPTQVRERLSDLAAEPHRIVASQVDDLLGHTLCGVAGRELEQLVPILAIPAELDRAPDLRRIATDGGARLFEHRRELLHAGGVAAGDVPHIGMPRDEPQRAWTGGPNPDRRMRLLDRFRIGDRIFETVVATVEVRPLLGPERLDDLQRLAEAPDPMVQPLYPVHLMLDLRPRGPDPELEPPARQVVDGDRNLREQRGVAVGVAGDEASDLRAAGRLA